MEKPRLVIEGKKGCYIIVSPDFKECKLYETNELLRPGEVILFGFEEKIDATADNDVSYKKSEITRPSAFKNLCEELIRRAEKNFIPYVLIEIWSDHEAAATWSIKARYQMLVTNKK